MLKTGNRPSGRHLATPVIELDVKYSPEPPQSVLPFEQAAIHVTLILERARRDGWHVRSRESTLARLTSRGEAVSFFR